MVPVSCEPQRPLVLCPLQPVVGRVITSLAQLRPALDAPMLMLPMCSYLGVTAAVLSTAPFLPPKHPTALADCLRCLGGLPLVALAQLAAYVFQLVGRCFLALPDLDPEAFKVSGLKSSGPGL